MAFLAPVAGKLILPTIAGGLLGAGMKLLSKKGAPAQALATPTRDDAAAAVAAEDELRRRKGGAADILNGVTGAEAVTTGGKLVLGS